MFDFLGISRGFGSGMQISATSKQLCIRARVVLAPLILIVFSFASFVASADVNVAAETSLAGSSQVRSFEERNNKAWGVSYFNQGGNQIKTMQDGGAGMSAYNYFSLNYKYSKDETFAIRPIFYVNTAGYNKYGENKSMDFAAGDVFFNYANYNLATLPGDWEFSGQFRFFLPTSEESQKSKMLTRLYSELAFEKEIDQNWDISYKAKPDYYVQTQKSFKNEYDKFYPDGGSSHIVEAKNNRLATWDHYVELSRYLNKYFTPYLALGFTHEWYYTSEHTDKGDPVVNKLKITPGTKLFTIKGLWFMFYLENEIGIDRTQMSLRDGTLQWNRDKYGNGNDENIALFRPEDTSFGFRTFWTIW